MKIAVIGCGSLIIEDDAIGIQAVRELKKRELPENVTVIEAGTPGLGLLDLIEGFDKAVIVDAVISGSEIGSINRFTDEILPPRDCIPFSLHGFNIIDAIELGKKIEPEKIPQIVIIGVEVEGKRNFQTGQQNNKTIEIELIVEEVLKEIGRV